MNINDFESKLKEEVDKNLQIIDLSQHNITDICSIRYLVPEKQRLVDVCVCPSKEIYDERSDSYTNDGGQPHRTISEVIDICKGFLDKLKNDKDFYAYTVLTDKELDEYENSIKQDEKTESSVDKQA